MKATIAFFWTLVAARFSSWDLSKPIQQWMREQLIPGYYLASQASKAKTAEERDRLRKLSAQILARSRDPTGLWGFVVERHRARRVEQIGDALHRGRCSIALE